MKKKKGKKPPGIEFRYVAMRVLRVYNKIGDTLVFPANRELLGKCEKHHILQIIGQLRWEFKWETPQLRKLVEKWADIVEPTPKSQAYLPILPPTPLAPSQEATIRAFYDSWEWKRLRYDFIKDQKRRCQCCGATAEGGAKIVVDHIKPIRRFWSARLDKTNLQLLCDDCNMGKGSRDETDWRVA